MKIPKTIEKINKSIVQIIEFFFKTPEGAYKPT